MTGIIVVFIVAILLGALGMPLAFALGISGVLGLVLVIGFDGAMGVVGATPFREAASLIFTTIPMFILMAEIANSSQITERLFKMAEVYMGKMRSGLGLATITAASIMGALSGSSSASAATFAATAAPAMEKRGYSSRLANGIVASSGTIAIMIPPSLAFIIYGVMTETSIGMLFLSGILPGILTAVLYALTVIFLVKREKKKGDQTQEEAYEPPQATSAEKVKMLRSLGPILLLVVIIMGGIYSGAMTATEAGAVGAFSILLITLLQRSLNWKSLNSALTSTLRTTTMIMTMVVCAYFFAYFMVVSKISTSIISWAGDLTAPPIVILMVILLIYALLGCFLDQNAVLIITIPLVFPLIMELGYDALWFGVLVTKTVEIGMLTPPFGMNCFVVAGTRNIRSEVVFRGVLPFIAAEIVCLAILVMFPEISTFIPNLVSNK